MSKDFITEDIKFLLQFAPATNVDDVHSGLLPMMYLTGSYDGDKALVQRVQDVIARYNIDVDSIDDLMAE